VLQQWARMRSGRSSTACVLCGGALAQGLPPSLQSLCTRLAAAWGAHLWRLAQLLRLCAMSLSPCCALEGTVLPCVPLVAVQGGLGLKGWGPFLPSAQLFWEHALWWVSAALRGPA